MARIHVAAALILATGSLATAQAADIAREPVPVVVADEWIVTPEGTVGINPRFPGSGKYSIFGYPSISYRHVGEPRRFSAPDDGFSVAVFDSPFFRFGPVARFRYGRFLDDDRRLFGVKDVRWAIEPGAFAEVWPIPSLRARMEIRHGINGHHGFVGNVAVDWVQPWERFTFSLGPRLAWGDDDFTRTYFGVRPFEAAINGILPPYRPDGGVWSVGGLASVSYDWSEAWRTTVFGGYDRLVSDAAASPIVRRIGSRDQFTFGLTLAYSFRMQALW